MRIRQVRKDTRRLFLTAIAMVATLPATLARSEPTGGVITAGAGTISRQGATTTITQLASPRMVVDWRTFSSSSGESIVFRQPDAAAIALNRVTGAGPSQLMGSLRANGQVFILNPNGVLFGPDSQVSVRGLLASTLGMDNASFLGGSQTLQGNSQAKVINQGRLAAADGGYIALVGPAVINSGAVSARSGDALLAAGDKVTLSIEGGSLIGYSMARGSVDALVDNTASGVISASGGRVLLAAGAADALSRAVINHAGIIEAQTLNRVEGAIRLMGDPAVGQLTLSGKLDASAPNGGNGGSVETSAAKVNIADSTTVSSHAANGRSGHWLIDPVDFEINAGNGAQTGSSIGAGALKTALDGADVTIGTSTGGPGAGAGDITVNAKVAWGAHKLTLAAQRNILFNASLEGGSVSLLYGQASADGGTADYVFNNGAKIDLNVLGGSFSTQKGSAVQNVKTYNIIRTLGTSNSADSSTLQGMASPGNTPNYVLGADIDASATRNWNGGAGFTPMPALVGTLDGLGHTVDSLQIHRQDLVGLFATTDQLAEVRNLGLTRAAISGSNSVGGIAGINVGTIRRSYVTGAVNGTLRTGGLAGQNNGSISTAYSEAGVNGIEVTGGLVGENAGGTISNSYASGRVDGVVDNPAASYTGGLVGFNRASIIGSYASGSTVGIAGVGGLAGQSVGLIQDSYAQGAVIGNAIVGGLVGRTSASSIIRNSYATGAVTGTEASTTRGLVGVTDSVTPGLVTNSYWNTDVAGNTGQGTPGAGEGRTGAELQRGATYSGWDIAATGGTQQVWRIYEGHGMPLLRTFLAPLVLEQARAVPYAASVQQNSPIPTAGPRTGSAASGRSAGTYRPYSNQQGYDISNGELVITPRPLSVAADIDTRVYNGTDKAKATFRDNRFAGDEFTIASASATFNTGNVGADKPVTVSGITLLGKDAGNYTVPNTLAATGKINPFSLFYNVTGLDKVYDGTTDATVSMSAVKIGNDDVFTNRTASFETRNAGASQTVTVTVTGLRGADAGNYTFTPPPTTTAAIRPKPLVVTANPDSKVFDGKPYQGGNGVTYAGLVPGETSAVLSGQLRYGGDAQGAVAIGNYRITPGGLGSANYASTFVDGALTVQPPLPDASPPVPVPGTPPPAPAPVQVVVPLTPLKPAFPAVEPVVAAVFASASGRSPPARPAPNVLTAPQLRVLDCGINLPENILLGACPR